LIQKGEAKGAVLVHVRRAYGQYDTGDFHVIQQSDARGYGFRRNTNGVELITGLN